MALTALILAAILTLAGAPPAGAQDTPRPGGVLKVATPGEPPTLDMPMSTATLTYEIMWHVTETLFAYDKSWVPAPMLAESDTVTDRGLRHTIALRRGVKFHNGKEMTSADVVPSLRRWAQLASVGKVLGRNIESIEATGRLHGGAPPQAALGFLAVRAQRAARRHLPEGEPRRRRRGDAEGVHRHGPVPLRRAPRGPARQARSASRTTRRAPTRRAASRASARRGWTRSCSSRSPTRPYAWPAWRPASTTTPCS